MLNRVVQNPIIIQQICEIVRSSSSIVIQTVYRTLCMVSVRSILRKYEMFCFCTVLIYVSSESECIHSTPLSHLPMGCSLLSPLSLCAAHLIAFECLIVLLILLYGLDLVFGRCHTTVVVDAAIIVFVAIVAAAAAAPFSSYTLLL